jgi:hypothetical protein
MTVQGGLPRARLRVLVPKAILLGCPLPSMAWPLQEVEYRFLPGVPNDHLGGPSSNQDLSLRDLGNDPNKRPTRHALHTFEITLIGEEDSE